MTTFSNVFSCISVYQPSLNQIQQMLATVYKHIKAETNGRHLADNISKCIFLNENVWIPIKISLKFVPKGRISNIPALVQTMAWRRPGVKPLSEPMMVSLPTHICVTRPLWVNDWSLPRQQYVGCDKNWPYVGTTLPTLAHLQCCLSEQI